MATSHRYAAFATITVAVISVAISLLPVPDSTAQSIRLGRGRYERGDWIAYTPMRHVTSVAYSPETIFFGTRGGIARWDTFDEKWLPPFTTADGLPGNFIHDLAWERTTNNLYAQTDYGAAVYNPVGDDWEYSPRFPKELAVGWQPVSLLGENLPWGYSGNPEGYITDPELRSYQIVGRYIDPDGETWIGTWGQFLWRRDFGTGPLSHQNYGLFQENVAAIARDDLGFWFGGPPIPGVEGGLTRFLPDSSIWTYFESRYDRDMISDEVFDIAIRGHTAWFATDRGLMRKNIRGGGFTSYDKRSGMLSDYVTAVAASDDLLWIGTDAGVNALLFARDSMVSATTEVVRNTFVFDIAVIDDHVWLGTDLGLYRLKLGTTEWKLFAGAGSILGDRVRAIAWDDSLIVCGTNRGIAVIERPGAAVTYFESPGIVRHGDVHSIVVTGTIIWAGTPNGLLRLDAVHPTDQRLFTTDDGLLDDFVQCIHREDDHLWLGTPEGVNRFRWNNPRRID